MKRKLVAAAVLATTLATPNLLAQTTESIKSPTEQRLKALEANSRQGWKWFGDCVYDWSGWKLNKKTGIRVTAKKCGATAKRAAGVKMSNLEQLDALTMDESIYIAVDCGKLRVSKYLPKDGRWARIPLISEWTPWKLPTDEDRSMTVLLCDEADTKGGR